MSAEPPRKAPLPSFPELPGYRIHTLWRRSRVGSWYIGWQLRIDRDVLIKVSPAGDARAARELEREARLLGKLRHPSLVTLIDFFREDGYAWAVYEFPGERSLEDEVQSRGGGLGPGAAARTMAAVADLLAALRERGFWPAQLSPGDFFIDEARRMRLASLEALQPGGAPLGEIGPLWRAGDGPDAAFVLGLLCFFVAVGKAPVSESLRESPERWLDIAARSLAAQARRGADAQAGAAGDAKRLLKILRRCFSGGGDAGFKDAASALRRLGGLPDAAEARPRRWTKALRPALLALALALGSWLGIALWRWYHAADGGAGRPADAGPLASAPPAPDGGGAGPAPGGARPAEAGPPSGEPEAPASGGSRAGGGLDAAASPAAGAAARVAGLDGVGSSSTGAAPQPLPSRSSVPLLDPEPPPGPHERFIARVALARKRPGGGPPWEGWEGLWEEGRRLAGAADDAAGATDDAAGAVEALPEGLAPGALGAFAGALLEARARHDARHRFAELFHGEVEAIDAESGRFAVHYDFSSRRHLEDWEAAGGSSRISIARGRLVVLGEARYRPGRVLEERVKVRLRSPADGRHPERPNINVILWVPAAAVGAASGAPAPVLFGVGVHPGEAAIPAAPPASRPLALPATAVLHLEGFPGALRPEAWTALWSEPGIGGDGELFEIEWSPERVRWQAAERLIASEDALRAAFGGRQALAGRRGAIGIHSFSSPLEIEDLGVEGRLDLDAILDESRSQARDALSREMPALASALADDVGR
jgi:hypothetical protein